MKETSHKNSLWIKSYIQNSKERSFFSIQSELSTFELWLFPNYCKLCNYSWLIYVKLIIEARDQNLLTGTKCDVYTLFFFLSSHFLSSLFLFFHFSFFIGLSLSLFVSLVVVVYFGCGFMDFGYGSGGDWFWFWLSFVSLAVGLVVVIDFAILVVGFLDFDGGGG